MVAGTVGLDENILARAWAGPKRVDHQLELIDLPHEARYGPRVLVASVQTLRLGGMSELKGERAIPYGKSAEDHLLGCLHCPRGGIGSDRNTTVTPSGSGRSTGASLRVGHCAIGLPRLCVDRTRHMETPRGCGHTGPKVSATQGMGIRRYRLPAHRSIVLAYRVRQLLGGIDPRQRASHSDSTVVVL